MLFNLKTDICFAEPHKIDGLFDSEHSWNAKKIYYLLTLKWHKISKWHRL